MHIANPQRFAAKLATAVLVGMMVGYGLATSSLVSAPSGPRSYCHANSCVLQTWLWMPALRPTR